MSRNLFRDRRNVGGTGNLEVVTAPTKIDDAFVVCVFQNSNEHPIAEAFGVTTEQLARPTTNLAGANGLFTRSKIADSTANEIECLGSSQSLTTRAGRRLGGRACFWSRPWFGHRARHRSGRWLGSRTGLANRMQFNGSFGERRRSCGRRHTLGLSARRHDARFAFAATSSTSTTTASRSPFITGGRLTRLSSDGRLRTSSARLRRWLSAWDVDLELSIVQLGDRQQPALRGLLTEA